MNQSSPSGLAADPRSAEKARPALYADAIGGVTTFFTMAYIVVVNPAVLSGSGTGIVFSDGGAARFCAQLAPEASIRTPASSATTLRANPGDASRRGARCTS